VSSVFARRPSKFFIDSFVRVKASLKKKILFAMVDGAKGSERACDGFNLVVHRMTSF
jgi:hypothetical protein